MKRFTFSVLTLVTMASSFVFTSCSEDNDNPNPTPVAKTASEKLMAKSWTMTAETETRGSTTVDTFKDYEACEKDDFLKFMAGNIFTADQGAVKCDPSDSQTLSGNWALSNSDKTLTFVVFGFGGQYTVEEISETKLVISETETTNGVTTVTRSTYTGK